MATSGWAGIDPTLLSRTTTRRATVHERVAQMGELALERDLLAWTAALLLRLKEQGRIRRWHHVPDQRRTRAEQAGMLDLHIGVRDGLVIALELKRPDGKGKLSPEQIDWLACWGDRGAVACSQEQVLEHLRRWGVVR